MTIPWYFSKEESAANNKISDSDDEVEVARRSVQNVILDVEEEGAGKKTKPALTPSPPREPIRWCTPDWKKKVWGVAAVALLILIIALIAASLKKLTSTEYGVSYTAYSKKLADSARTGGLHLGPPGYEFIKFPSTQVTVDLPEDTCISQDGLRVKFSVTFQYQMPAEWLLPAILKYRDFENWAKVVEAAGNSAIHHSCADFQISNFQNMRGAIQTTMEDNLRLKLEGVQEDGSDGVYARAISLQLRNVELPEEYREAVREKQAAAEDIILAQNERTQETTRAQTTLLAAQEEARIINNTAVNEAEILLTEAEIKAQETTFAFNEEARVLVSVRDALNLSTEGVLAYMSNRLYAEASGLKVSAAEPARLSRKDEL